MKYVETPPSNSTLKTADRPPPSPRAEVEKGVEHGSIAPRRKWIKPFLAEGFWPSVPHLPHFCSWTND